MLTDLGLTPVSSAAVLPDIWIPGDARAASLDTWKRRCEQFSTIGLQKIYCPSITNRRVTADDFKATPGCIRETGDIAKQFNLTAMIEFARTSTHLSTLRSSLTVIREAAHSNVRPMLDFFHFWSGMSKFEDLDMIRPGEIAHVHFQDILDTPRELMDNNGRVIPGDGAAPVVAILRKLAEKQYSGPLSVELFLMELQQGDPFEVASRIKQKCEAVMRTGGCAVDAGIRGSRRSGIGIEALESRVQRPAGVAMVMTRPEMSSAPTDQTLRHVLRAETSGRQRIAGRAARRARWCDGPAAAVR